MAVDVGVGLLGCGVVGSAVVRGLQSLSPGSGVTVRAVAVRDVAKRRECALPPGVVGADPFGVVEDPSVDVVVEAMGGSQPAGLLLARALELGKPVITANKEVLGTSGPMLRELAADRGALLLFEAAVAGAVPVIRGLAGLLQSDEIIKIEGVLNGTTTFVLSYVEETGATISEALVEARRFGFCEADWSRDLDGSDAADKLAVLAQYLFGEAVYSADVQRLGIDVLGRDDILGSVDRCWRLVATAVRGRCARAEPVALRRDHPFARLTGPQNAVTMDGVAEAARRLQPVIKRTPVETSVAISAAAGAEVVLKCEHLQRTGSFKIRGAYNHLAQLTAAERERGWWRPRRETTRRAWRWPPNCSGCPRASSCPRRPRCPRCRPPRATAPRSC